MGLVKEPEIRDYWSNDDTFHYAPIAGRISRLRFEEVSRYLHFVDSSQLPAQGTPGHHRLQRVKPIIDALCSRCSTLYRPRANLSVDEAMVPFKGLNVYTIVLDTLHIYMSICRHALHTLHVNNVGHTSETWICSYTFIQDDLP